MAVNLTKGQKIVLKKDSGAAPLTVKIDVSKMQIFYFGLRLVAGQTFVIIG